MSTEKTTYPYVMTRESITLTYKGKMLVVQQGATNFRGLRTALLEENWDDVPNHISTGKSIEAWAKGKFSVSGSTIMYGGKPIPDSLTSRITNMASAGEDPTSLFKFWERLQNNPSYRSVNQLWMFLDNVNIPIDSEGFILAYKAVSKDYKDFHTGKYDNTPGTTNSMPRNEISDDPEIPCHEGFHVGALGYASSFGAEDRRIVICRVDPKDVVCVPKDESFQKVRTCQYTVIGNYGCPMPSTTISQEEVEGCEPDVQEEDEAEGTDTDDHQGGDEDQNEEPRDFNNMWFKDLMEQSISDLRRYASARLKIVGASKIPGGKTALISKILEVRRV